MDNTAVKEEKRPEQTAPDRAVRQSTILVVDDEQVNRMIIRKVLENDYHILEAGDGKEAIEVIKDTKDKVSAVVLDLFMPEADGFVVLEFIRQNENYANVPVLVTTGENDSVNEKRCLEAGAWDFVRKPIDKDTLKLRLKNIIGRSQFNVQKHERYLAEHDRLTGLYSRTKFFNNADRMIKKSTGQKPYAFVRIDIDRFRLYNTFFGESEGDRLLIYFSDCIKAHAAMFDEVVIGRIEGDVFGMCCPYVKENIEKLRANLIGDLQNYIDTYYIEPSIGVCVTKDAFLSIEEAYDRATMAAEPCKHKFMSDVGYYDAHMSRQMLTEQELMNEAQKALDEEQFAVYLQPKTNIHTGKTCGAEALVRWMHPTKGMISPGKFIPVFESNGFIGRLDRYMWKHTCMLLRKWIDLGLDPFPVSVNVSRADMYNPNLIEDFKGLINRYQISERLLQLEITESAFMDDTQMMIEKVKALRENGFTVLMDDFGSGYSSLNTLKDIPVDILKIDMKFLGSKTEDGKSERILASVVSMAAWLDLVVIVEGVETNEQRNFLESIGCEYVQGFYYARPMPWQEYEKTLQYPENYQKNTSREETEKEEIKFLDENEQLKKLFYTLLQPAAVFVCQQGEIRLIQKNREFYQQFHRSDFSQGMVDTDGSRLSAKHKRKLRAAFDRCTEKEKTAGCKFLRYGDGGQNNWYHVNLHYLNRTDDSVQVMAVFYEVSGEKEIEEEIRQAKKTESLPE